MIKVDLRELKRFKFLYKLKNKRLRKNWKCYLWEYSLTFLKEFFEELHIECWHIVINYNFFAQSLNYKTTKSIYNVKNKMSLF